VVIKHNAARAPSSLAATACAASRQLSVGMLYSAPASAIQLTAKQKKAKKGEKKKHGNGSNDAASAVWRATWRYVVISVCTAAMSQVGSV